MRGKAKQGKQVRARKGNERHGRVRQCKAEQWRAGRVKETKGVANQGMAWLGNARRG
jgi:hypothetical protein